MRHILLVNVFPHFELKSLHSPVEKYVENVFIHFKPFSGSAFLLNGKPGRLGGTTNGTVLPTGKEFTSSNSPFITRKLSHLS